MEHHLTCQDAVSAETRAVDAELELLAFHGPTQSKAKQDLGELCCFCSYVKEDELFSVLVDKQDFLD